MRKQRHNLRLRSKERCRVQLSIEMNPKAENHNRCNHSANPKWITVLWE